MKTVAYRFLLIILFIQAGCTFLLAQEKGVASYYADRLHGRLMSDGTPYHRDSMTCAHRRYPLGTMLKVTNLKNDKSVVVKVTDRCGTRRMIDLSYAAAKQLGIIRQGLATVRVERYTPSMCVPFKIDGTVELPELDFSINNEDDDITPIWMRTDDEDKATDEIKDHHRHEKGSFR